jgi:hypothetical protein
MHYVRIFGLSAALLIAGCNGELDPNPSAVESESPPVWLLVLTAETAFNTESGNLETTLTAALLEDSGPTPTPVTLQLNSGDSLRATDGVQAIDLEPLENEDRIYTGTFPLEVVGQDLILSLSKITPPVNVDWWVPTGDSPEPDFSDFFIDAPNTQLRLPPAFTIDSPAYDPNPPDPPDPDDGIDDDGMEEFALGSDVTLTWSPANSEADMRLVYTSSCGNSLSGVNILDIDGDPGSYTAKVDDYLTGQSGGAIQNVEGCVIRLTLERRTEDNNLTPDPALSTDSNLVATYRRFIEIKVP